jgi:hypothetical protein
VVTFLTLVTTDTVSGMIHLVSRCPTQAKASTMPQPRRHAKNAKKPIKPAYLMPIEDLWYLAGSRGQVILTRSGGKMLHDA